MLSQGMKNIINGMRMHKVETVSVCLSGKYLYLKKFHSNYLYLTFIRSFLIIFYSWQHFYFTNLKQCLLYSKI